MSAREPAKTRKRQIADAALRIIADRGLRDFTTAALAREVGITEGAVFRHFASKEAIVLAAIERVDELLSGALPPHVGDPLARLRELFERRVRLVRAHGAIPRLVFSDDLSFAADGAGKRRIDEIRSQTLAHVVTCLHEANASGRLRLDVDVAAAAIVVQGAMMALAFARDDLPAGVEQRVWATIEAMLRA